MIHTETASTLKHIETFNSPKKVSWLVHTISSPKDAALHGGLR